MIMNGIHRRIDDLGRIVIPAEYRKTLNIKQEELLDISIDGKKIILSKIFDEFDYENLYRMLIEEFVGSSYKNFLLTNKSLEEFRSYLEKYIKTKVKIDEYY